MRVAVIADVHGDLDALRTLSPRSNAYADQIWRLSDIVGLGATTPITSPTTTAPYSTTAPCSAADRWLELDLAARETWPGTA